MSHKIGRDILKHILCTYSAHNPRIGYAQSMNFIAAFLLILVFSDYRQMYENVQNLFADFDSLSDSSLRQIEETTFWLFTYLMDLIPDYHVSTLVGAHVTQSILESLFKNNLPDAASHFEEMGVSLSLITLQWIFTLFLSDFPFELVLPV
jgi:hypothetical protein